MIPVAFHPLYRHPLPEGHRFPMQKYELLPEQLLYEGTLSQSDFFSPEPASLDAVCAVHDPGYVDALCCLSIDPRAARKVGFPLSAELVERELRITQGTIDGSLKALETGIAFNIAGGTHHAYRAHGEAFCLLNDQAVAAQYLLDHGQASRILIVDLDVHQGNGTASIFAGRHDVFTFSMHGRTNYPFKKEQSHLDIALEDGTDDAVYLKTLHDILPPLLRKTAPDFVFYLAGVDILATDKLGKLGCTVEGCRQRDRFVLSVCREAGIPVQCSMGGGYSPDIQTIIEAHANTYREAVSLYR
ncbi:MULTISPECIES: histone deacetylase [unclassified Flavobacterium]|uniref:histone deacetylase family protein n=1 Tax=unclassified Flavobacterium TaxID=196869 RepID=UPI001F1374E0|nr:MULTISPECIES: histone deacetylase [unclassified Flavobacterium]UMY66170.1 histone deacetylase [Flavobacterium sp. HJ-32-4]